MSIFWDLLVKENRWSYRMITYHIFWHSGWNTLNTRICNILSFYKSSILHVNWNKVSKCVEETTMSYKDCENSDQQEGWVFAGCTLLILSCTVSCTNSAKIMFVQYHILLRVQIWSARFAISLIARKRTMLSSIKFDPPFCFMAT